MGDAGCSDHSASGDSGTCASTLISYFGFGVDGLGIFVSTPKTMGAVVCASRISNVVCMVAAGVEDFLLHHFVDWTNGSYPARISGPEI